MAGIIGPQTTTENLTLGKGKVFFADVENPTSFRFIGNCPGLTLTIEREVLEHFDSTSGIGQKDASVTTQVNRSGSVSCDNINMENLGLFFFGSTSLVSVGATTVTNELHTDVVLGNVIQLGVSTVAPSGVRGLDVGTVVVTDTTATTTFTAGTDYVVDHDLGTIYIPSTSTIPAGSDIHVDYDTVVNSRNQALSGSEPKTVALKYISDNPKGPNRDFYCPNVVVTPDGDLSLIGDDWTVMNFSLEILTGAAGEEAIYVDGRPTY